MYERNAKFVTRRVCSRSSKVNPIEKSLFIERERRSFFLDKNSCEEVRVAGRDIIRRDRVSPFKCFGTTVALVYYCTILLKGSPYRDHRDVVRNIVYT